MSGQSIARNYWMVACKKSVGVSSGQRTTRRLDVRMRKYRKLFKERGWLGRHRIVREQKLVNRNTRRCNVRRRRWWQG